MLQKKEEDEYIFLLLFTQLEEHIIDTSYNHNNDENKLFFV